MTKTFVLLSWHVTVQRSDVRPTLRDVMMMYSKEPYMENLPFLSAFAQEGAKRDRIDFWGANTYLCASM